MIRIVVIGGTGHIGTFLTPRLAELGYDVVYVSRELRQPYRPHESWRKVEQATLDRVEEEDAGTLWAADRAIAPRSPNRSDLLPHRERPDVSRGAARARAALSALRDDLGARTCG